MKILLSAYTGLGNFVLKTPLIRKIHEQFPGARVDLICGDPWGADQVLFESKWIYKIHWCARESSFFRKLQMLYELRRESYDMVLCPFDSTPDYFDQMVELLGADRVISHINLSTISFKGKVRIALKMLVMPRRIWVPVLVGRHETDLNLDLLEPVLDRPTKRDLKTFVCWHSEDISRFNLPNRYICIQPSAKNGEVTPKVWNPKNFSEVIRDWRARYPDDYFVLVGDDGDKRSLEEAGFTADGVIDLLGKTSFNQLCNVLQGSLLVLSHDSGIMHIANALGRPLVALYGPTDFSRTAPLAPTSRMLHSRNECWARMYAFRNNETHFAEKYPPYFCMSSITKKDVIESLENMLIDLES